ncbi:MAG TPA: hypothetical protein DEQ14_06830 [Treponema sp.]|nr:hypothetical protein [Treponema sp.]
MKKIALGTMVLILCAAPAVAMEYNSGSILFNSIFNAGSFSAGEYDAGSVFLGTSLSADWIPVGKTGLSYGIETGILGGKKQDGGIITGIPVMFRLGWHPAFFKMARVDIFVLGKFGWAFGIWGSHLDQGSTPGAAGCGINIGGSYAISPAIRAYTEIGYNYYGLARNSGHSKYPLGYGSGKVYVSAGVSVLVTP